MAEENRASMYHLRVLPALATYIRKHALFRPGERVGVAVSGGADSVALLRALLELREELGVVLGVVHVHHGIRGSEADGDQQFVQHLAKKFDLILSVERVDVPQHRKRTSQSLETSARTLRYDFFQRLLNSGTFDKIATAHTRDDQAETVLLRILRGTGTRGLAAIPPFRNASPALAARIVRPLLSTSREQVEQYLQSLHQSWREDASNRDPRHLRNRIRHELLPLLESEYNPALRQSLVNLAEIARVEEEHWSAETSALQALVKDQDDGVEISRPQLLLAPLALRRRLLVAVADQLDLPVGFDEIELMLHLAAHPGSQHTFEGGWSLRSNKLCLKLQHEHIPSEEASFDLPLPIPGGMRLPNGLEVRVTLLSCESAAELPAGKLLGADLVQMPLRLRNWQPGDRFWPTGGKRQEKLKRLFQERHIPMEERVRWPVVLSGDEIVWVRGFPVADGRECKQGSGILIEVQE